MSERPSTEVRASFGMPMESQATVIIQRLDLLEKKTDALDAKVDRIQIDVAETKRASFTYADDVGNSGCGCRDFRPCDCARGFCACLDQITATSLDLV